MLTVRQQEIWDAYEENDKNSSKTAEKLGCARQTVDASIKTSTLKRAKMGLTDDMDVAPHVGPGYAIKGVSTLVGEDGKAKLRWVKTDLDKLAQEEAMAAVIAGMNEEIEPAKPVEREGIDVKPAELINLYTITDYHLGMLSWEEETGDNWNTSLAEDALVEWFNQAIQQSPESQKAVFAQLGDFMHWDGFDAVTPSSGHLLDADTRFQRLVRVSIRVIRRVIEMLLKKHDEVIVIMAEGNHDMSSSIWLRELFSTLYDNEPRVRIDINPDPYYCVEHGDCSLFFHHGHLKNFKAISEVFASKYREIFGRTKHSFAHMGHFHHGKMEENNLMVVEQHRTLSGKDAYATRGGYMAGRDAKVITYHEKYGEVSRVTINYYMIGH
ncbi:MAG: winged helix-turn-helix domain-containing protein [Gammaproteobacteria bacterium]|nr:winged helix-turn-helix domain-containing protein [Gammaproteobacteria bacterium]